MPARSSHLPNHYERSALTKLASGRELPAAKLFPASRQTIAKLLEKGWIERAEQTQVYRITEAGKAALRAEMLSIGRRVQIVKKPQGLSITSLASSEMGARPSERSLTGAGTKEAATSPVITFLIPTIHRPSPRPPPPTPWEQTLPVKLAAPAHTTLGSFYEAGSRNPPVTFHC
jgi:hypothetical protein